MGKSNNSQTKNRKNKPVIYEPKEDIVSPIPKDKAGIIGIESSSFFNGPLPPPEIFREYGNVVNDAPERILRVFEQDSKHVREMQSKALEMERVRDTRAQWMTFGVMVLSLSTLVFSVIYGNLSTSIATGIVTVITSTRLFFIRNNPNKDTKKETSEK